MLQFSLRSPTETSRCLTRDDQRPRRAEKEGLVSIFSWGHILWCLRVFWLCVLLNTPIVDVLDGWPLSCQEAESLDLCRQEGVDDEDYGLGAGMKVQLNLGLGASKVEEHHANSII